LRLLPTTELMTTMVGFPWRLPLGKLTPCQWETQGQCAEEFIQPRQPHLSRGMNGWGFRAYNAQAAVGCDHKVDREPSAVSTRPAMWWHSLPMLEATRANTGQLANIAHGERVYCGSANLRPVSTEGWMPLQFPPTGRNTGQIPMQSWAGLQKGLGRPVPYGSQGSAP